MEQRCHACDKTPEQATLSRCPICFKHSCEAHTYDRNGVRFCSSGCAQYFFFGDPDDKET